MNKRPTARKFFLIFSILRPKGQKIGIQFPPQHQVPEQPTVAAEHLPQPRPFLTYAGGNSGIPTPRGACVRGTHMQHQVASKRKLLQQTCLHSPSPTEKAGRLHVLKQRLRGLPKCQLGAQELHAAATAQAGRLSTKTVRLFSWSFLILQNLGLYAIRADQTQIHTSY